MHTYFIQSPKGGNIKIGKAIDPFKRRKELETGAPDGLIVMGYIKADCESRLHQQFAPLRVRKGNEFFKPDPELLEFILENAEFADSKTRRIFREINFRSLPNKPDYVEKWGGGFVVEKGFEKLSTVLKEYIEQIGCTCDFDQDFTECDRDCDGAWLENATWRMEGMSIVDHFIVNPESKTLTVIGKDVNSGKREEEVDELATIFWYFDEFNWTVRAVVRQDGEQVDCYRHFLCPTWKEAQGVPNG
jgi:hypothetical protein